MIKILLDTNLFIYLEDNKVTDEKVMQLIKNLFDSNEYKIVIHPLTKFEIDKMKDDDQKRIFKSKIAVHKEIVAPPTPDKAFHNLVGCKNGHDLIDNVLLFAVKQNCVSYLITNDNKLKKKSDKIGLSDRVLSIDEALEKFKPEKNEPIPTPPFIQEKFLYQLDIDDPFFDSLKKDYDGFDEWFAKKQKGESKTYVTMDNKLVTSFLMLKLENEKEDYSNFDKPFKPGKRLKVSTMKVVDTGKKIGETFIKLIVKKAIESNVDEIYVTAFSKQSYLIDLLTDYGFKYYTFKWTTKSDGTKEKEGIYVKNAKPVEEFYPFINVKDKKCFIVPIRERYHNILFQESEHSFQLSLEDIKGLNTASNSLRKAYLCDSNIKQITPSSLLLFYASGSKKAITSLGVVDAVFNDFKDFDDMYSLIKKRTAYNEKELKAGFKNNKLVILFKLYYPFDNYVSFKFLLDKRIVNGAIQTIQQINNNSLKLILDECKIDRKKYLID